MNQNVTTRPFQKTSSDVHVTKGASARQVSIESALTEVSFNERLVENADGRFVPPRGGEASQADNLKSGQRLRMSEPRKAHGPVRLPAVASVCRERLDDLSRGAASIGNAGGVRPRRPREPLFEFVAQE